MNPAQKALWFIESHLAEALTLDEIAGVAGVSRFHMVRAFAAATGLSVMRYVRARRLSEAARALAGGAPDILDAGAGCGLRLSRSIHPRVPRPFRGHARSGPQPRRVSTISSFRSRSSWISSLTDNLQAPRFETSKPLLVAGIGERYNHENGAGIPGQWQRFHQSVDEYSRPDRAGRLRRLLQRRRCRQFRLHRRRRSRRLLRPAARILPAFGFPNSDTRCLPTANTSRPFAAPSTRSGITGCRRRA